MELSAEDLEDIPVVIQNDQVLECTIRFECKKSNTSEKLFHYFYPMIYKFCVVLQKEIENSIWNATRAPFSDIHHTKRTVARDF